MATKLGKIERSRMIDVVYYAVVGVVVAQVVFRPAPLHAQSNPFYSAYQSGLLTTDRFNASRAISRLQPNLLSEISGIVTSANIQSRFTGFGVYALDLQTAFSLPGNFGTGVSFQSIGNADFKLTGITLQAGKKLGEAWSIGVGQTIQRSRIGSESRPWNGHSTISAGYNSGNWGMAIRLAGLMTWIRPEVQSPFTVQISAYVAWLSTTQMFFLLSYDQEETSPTIGIRHIILEEVELFGAFQLYPARYGIGFALPLTDRLRSIVSTEYHPVLGWSPSAGLNLAIGQK